MNNNPFTPAAYAIVVFLILFGVFLILFGLFNMVSPAFGQTCSTIEDVNKTIPKEVKSEIHYGYVPDGYVNNYLSVIEATLGKAPFDTTKVDSIVIYRKNEKSPFIGVVFDKNGCELQHFTVSTSQMKRVNERIPFDWQYFPENKGN